MFRAAGITRNAGAWAAARLGRRGGAAGGRLFLKPAPVTLRGHQGCRKGRSQRTALVTGTVRGWPATPPPLGHGFPQMPRRPPAPVGQADLTPCGLGWAAAPPTVPCLWVLRQPLPVPAGSAGRYRPRLNLRGEADGLSSQTWPCPLQLGDRECLPDTQPQLSLLHEASGGLSLRVWEQAAGTQSEGRALVSVPALGQSSRNIHGVLSQDRPESLPGSALCLQPVPGMETPTPLGFPGC